MQSSVIYHGNHTEDENKLLNTVDNLCRVAGMLCSVIEQDLDGHIETADPLDYVYQKLSNSEGYLEFFFKKT